MKLNPVLPPPRRQVQKVRNPVDILLHARSARQVRHYFARYRQAMHYGIWKQGQSRSGKPVWINQDTGERRYQEKEPGAGRPKKEGQAAAKPKSTKPKAAKAQGKELARLPSPEQLQDRVDNLRNAADKAGIRKEAKALAQAVDQAAASMSEAKFRTFAAKVMGRSVKRGATTDEVRAALSDFIKTNAGHAAAGLKGRAEKTQRAVDDLSAQFKEEREKEGRGGEPLDEDEEFERAWQEVTGREMKQRRGGDTSKAREAKKAKHEAKMKAAQKQTRLAPGRLEEPGDPLEDLPGGLDTEPTPATMKVRTGKGKRGAGEGARRGTAELGRQEARKERAARFEAEAELDDENELINRLLEEPGLLEDVIAHTGYDPGERDPYRRAVAVVERLTQDRPQGQPAQIGTPPSEVPGSPEHEPPQLPFPPGEELDEGWGFDDEDLRRNIEQMRDTDELADEEDDLFRGQSWNKRPDELARKTGWRQRQYARLLVHALRGDRQAFTRLRAGLYALAPRGRQQMVQYLRTVRARYYDRSQP